MTVCSQAALVIFTVSGTITSSGVPGYALGGAITITYVANGDLPTYSVPNGSIYEWYEETLTEDVVFTSVNISGASGTWSRPSTSEEAPENILVLISGSPSDIAWNAVADIADDPAALTGLFINGQPVVNILSQAQIGPPFSFSSGAETIGSYFSDYQGTHPLIPYTNGAYSWIRLLDGSEIQFNSTSVNIAVIPEPSGILFGGVAVLGMLRRRRR